jgi:plastocyanin
MTLRRALAPVLVALVAVLAPAAARPQAATLVGVVGTDDAFEISLADSSGESVRHLDPGTYTIVVHDRSSFHDFHLQGPGVNMSTEVGTVGDATWTVTLTDGVYDYFCDPHRPQMHGSFTVGTPPVPVAPKRLSASVGPGKRIALSGPTGARPRQLAAGRYVVAVRDRTSRDNFRLRGPGVNRATGVRFVGRRSWSVTLRTGRYTFGSDRHRGLRGAFTVTC